MDAIYAGLNEPLRDLSVTRVGDFWKFLVTIFLTKLAQINDVFLG